MGVANVAETSLGESGANGKFMSLSALYYDDISFWNCIASVSGMISIGRKEGGADGLQFPPKSPPPQTPKIEI